MTLTLFSLRPRMDRTGQASSESAGILYSKISCIPLSVRLTSSHACYSSLGTISGIRCLFSPRKGLERDTPFIKYQAASGTGRFMAFFGAEQTHFTSDSSKRFRYYTNPVLVISRNVDSILRYSSDTTSAQFVNAQTAVVHELTHYLQCSYDEPLPYPTTEGQYQAYFKLRSEQEAFIVAACFFTKKFSPATFKEIVSTSKSLPIKVDDLVNYHFRMIGYKVHWKSMVD